MNPDLHGKLLSWGLAIVAATGCTSVPDSAQPADSDSPATLPPIGRVLTETDLYLRLWNNSALAEPNEKNQKQVEGAENSIREAVRIRFDEFARELETGSRRNRLIAAAALGFSNDPRALPYLVRTLRDPEGDIVANALLGIGVLRAKDTPLDPLIEALEHHPEASVRSAAAFSLKRLVETGLNGTHLASSLRAALRDPEPGVRAQAAASLGSLRDGDAVDGLIVLLGDSKPLVAAASAYALGRIKNPKALEPLRNSLDSPSPRVREAAHKALIEITGEDRGPNAWGWKN